MGAAHLILAKNYLQDSSLRKCWKRHPNVQLGMLPAQAGNYIPPKLNVQGIKFLDHNHNTQRRKEKNLDMVKVMAMNQIRSLRCLIIMRETVGEVGRRTFATGSAKAKKGGKGGAASDAPKASILSKEVKSTTVVAANILKDGADPKILPDSEYPDWLYHLLDKRPALSELRRKNIETLPYEDLKRFVKLDNRARIKENNSIKAKN